MFKRISSAAVAVVFLLSLGGCATARRQKDLEMQSLRNQITVLESQLQSRDQEITALRESLSNKNAGIVSTPVTQKYVAGIKSRPNARQIQSALKNAGYYMGNLDGKMGKQTKSAVKEFQKANNLPVDGKVGRKTWEVLGKYLVVKTK